MPYSAEEYFMLHAGSFVRSLSVAQAQIDELTEENAKLKAEVAKLKPSPSEKPIEPEPEPAALKRVK